jgi:hypothetical protein
MTAVEWLIDQLITENEVTLKGENYKLFEMAIEMEKQQIVDFGYDIADDLACGVFRDKKSMEKRYDEFLVFRSEEDEDV